MSESTTLPEISKIETIVEIAQKHLPRMMAGSEKAVLAMQVIQNIENEEQYENAENLLGRVKSAYEKINELRTEITGPLDEVKKYLMTFERPLGDDKSSEYTRVRGIMTSYRQAELEKKKELEAKAAYKKHIDDHIVDLKSTVLKWLTDKVIEVAKRTDASSADYFNKSTLEDFDARAEQYMRMKPKMKQEDYDACFKIVYNPALIAEDEFNILIHDLKQEQTFDKWNEEVVKVSTPIVNEWRGKIPDLKKKLIELKNASDETERARIAAAQKEKEDQEAARRGANLDEQALSANREIESQAGLSKMENSFVEQAVVQQAGDGGPTKLVLKFKDAKDTPQALMTIIYHCLAHKEFPGIQKRDRKGNLVVDDKGRPEYIDGVQQWINFFLAKCDADIAGTVVYEDSKITIRK
jgi:hypothetical protein